MFLITKNMFSSNPFLMYKTPVNIIVDTYNYCKFIDKYQATFKELNKKDD